MTSLNQRIKILEVYSGIETSVISISDVSELQTELDTKQDTLTAGDNITIVDNVISSSGSGGTSASNICEITGLQDELDSKQNVLTAGDNITIVDNVISSSGSSSSASLISDVSGLQVELDSKQNVLTSGDNITIVDNVISSTGGGGSSFVGFKSVVNPGLGLVTIGGGNISTYFNDTTTLPYSYDTNGLFNTSTGIFTANTSGYWQISFKFYIYDGEATQAQTNQLKLIRDGVESALFITGLYNGQNDEVNTCCPLLAGDQIFIYHFTGTTRYILDTATAFFEARFIGV